MQVHRQMGDVGTENCEVCIQREVVLALLVVAHVINSVHRVHKHLVVGCFVEVGNHRVECLDAAGGLIRCKLRVSSVKLVLVFGLLAGTALRNQAKQCKTKEH